MSYKIYPRSLHYNVNKYKVQEIDILTLLLENLKYPKVHSI